MKKIILFIVFLLILLVSIFIAKINKNQQAFYFANFTPEYDQYDINSFSYNSKEKEFSIDVFYWIDYWHWCFSDCKDIISPKGENVIFIIFNTLYNEKNNKIIIKYKGYVGINKNNRLIIHYTNDNSFIYNYDYHLEKLKEILSDKKFDYAIYKKDVINYIFEKYKNNEINEIPVSNVLSYPN